MAILYQIVTVQVSTDFLNNIYIIKFIFKNIWRNVIWRDVTEHFKKLLFAQSLFQGVPPFLFSTKASKIIDKNLVKAIDFLKSFESPY